MVANAWAVAQVLTVGIFGTIFSALSEAEKPTMVFLANAVSRQLVPRCDTAI